jgi:hypothetical protein
VGKRKHIELITRELNGAMKTFKECSICSEVKELSDYYKSKYGLGGHSAKCKSCTSKFFKKYNKTDATISKVFERDGKEFKKCKKCKETKEVSEFYPHGAYYVSKCKICYKQDQRKGTGPKPIKIVEIDGKESKECRGCGEILPLEDFSLNKNGSGVLQRKASCKDCMRIYWKRRREENKDSHNEQSRRWRLANPSKQLASQKRWRLKNRDKDSVYRNRRKAKQFQLRNDLTHEQWQGILAHFNYACALTGEETSVTMDHFIPISTERGGTYVGNVYPLSSTLNNSKHNRNPFLWFERYGLQHGVEESAWNRLIKYLAEANGMTEESFIEYINTQFEEVPFIDEAN